MHQLGGILEIYPRQVQYINKQNIWSNNAIFSLFKFAPESREKAIEKEKAKAKAKGKTEEKKGKINKNEKTEPRAEVDIHYEFEDHLNKDEGFFADPKPQGVLNSAQSGTKLIQKLLSDWAPNFKFWKRNNFGYFTKEKKHTLWPAAFQNFWNLDESFINDTQLK